MKYIEVEKLFYLKGYFLAEECASFQKQTGWQQSLLVSNLNLRQQQGYKKKLEFPNGFVKSLFHREAEKSKNFTCVVNVVYDIIPRVLCFVLNIL